jgi:hypothetical protein
MHVIQAFSAGTNPMPETPKADRVPIEKRGIMEFWSYGILP